LLKIRDVIAQKDGLQPDILLFFDGLQGYFFAF